MNNQIDKSALERISSFFKSETVVIDAAHNKFILKDAVGIKETICKSFSIEFSTEGKDLHLKIKKAIGNLNLVLYEVWNFFEVRFIETNLIVLNADGDYCFYEAGNEALEFSSNCKETFKTSCENLLAQAHLYSFLKSNEFADHHNSGKNEIVLYSSSNGIFKVKYESVFKVYHETNHSKNIVYLLERTNSIHIYPFLKSAIYTFCKDTMSITLSEIIENSRAITDLALRNFDIVSKQFNFDNFKDALHKEKDKYFNSIRDVVNKIFSQAVGIPISIGATAFAAYRVEGDKFFLLIILFTFLVFVFYYVRIQLFYKRELNVLRSDFINDFNVIEMKSGLDSKSIEQEKTKILNKIDDSKSIVSSLIGIIVLLGLTTIIYVLSQVFQSTFSCTDFFLNLVNTAFSR